jgi:hypothetical protein
VDIKVPGNKMKTMKQRIEFVEKVLKMKIQKDEVGAIGVAVNVDGAGMKRMKVGKKLSSSANKDLQHENKEETAGNITWDFSAMVHFSLSLRLSSLHCENNVMPHASSFQSTIPGYERCRQERSLTFDD